MFANTSLRIIYRACRKWSEHGGTQLGAAFAYYALFSIAPLLLIAIYLAGAIFGKDAAHTEVRRQLQQLMGNEVAHDIEQLMRHTETQDTFWTPTVSVLFLIFASLSAFLQVRSALCTIWSLEPPQGNGWLGLLWDYVLSLIMVFITATILLISLAFGLAVPIVQKMVSEHMMDAGSYWQWVELALSFIFLTLLFASSYRVLSGLRIPWSYVWYGSFIAAVLFTIGKTLFSYYLVYSGAESMYGAAGSVIVLLMWVYYSSQTLFFGAELIQARRTRFEWLYGEKPAP